MISHVLPAQLDFVWDQVEPHVERGLKHGAGDSTTSREIRKAIRRGEMLMWAIHDGPEVTAVVVLEVVQHPAKKTLFVVLVAGRDFHSWAPEVRELLLDYRDLIGADTIETLVRDGLTRWLVRYGWERKATLMEMKDGR